MTMRLATRLTIHYVSSVAVILIGFSVALFAMTASQLHRQVDEQIGSALNTLMAAAEIGPEGATWESEERDLVFGNPAVPGRFSWRVADGHGQRLDGSDTGEIDLTLAKLFSDSDATARFATFHDRAGVPWRAASRRVEPSVDPESATSSDSIEKPHESLILSAATSLDGMFANLRDLALTLVGLSLVIWTLALVTAHRLCRLILHPLSEMAEAAQSISGDEVGGRLPARQTDDELGELGRSFNALLARLGESLERQQRFTGDASHQLATPLTAIQGHVDLALRLDRPPEEYRRALGLVQAKTRHLRQIVDGLTFLARADAEARRPTLERVQLDLWLPEHIAAWQNPRRADVVFESDGAGPCYALVHPPLLGELLDNLLENAAKYSPAHSPIPVHLSEQDDRITISVANEGPGIEPDDLPHIFDPFFRSESARIRGSQGLGLGLSIAARIATLFAGQITVASTPGERTTFSVILPKSESAEAPSAGITTDASAEST